MTTNMSSVYDIFQSPYYKTNYFYWRLLGLWTHDDFKIIKRVIVSLTLVSFIVPQVFKLYEEWNNDFDVAIETVGNLLYFGACLFKYLSFLRVETQMTLLFDKIANDWRSITYKEEIKKLKEYGLTGRRLTLGYIIPINVILVVYITVPLIAVLLDIVNPLNETRPRIFPNPVEYFIDDQKYYFPIYFHGSIACLLSVQIYGTFDSTYVCCVQHACALFSIVEIRMRRVVEVSVRMKHKIKLRREDEEYKNTRAAILLHKEAIQFVDEIGKSYSFVFFLTITMTSVAICIAAVIVLLQFENGDTKYTTRFASLYVGYSFHLLYNMSPGQSVIDHSTDIHNAVYNCGWYDLSSRTKQLLTIVMMRSLKPCRFTGQKIIELNLESFASVFRRSLSYVTVLGSMR